MTMTETSPDGHTAGSPLVDKLKGKAKRLAGTITGNDGLKVEGRLHEERATANKDSHDLTGEALQPKAESQWPAREREILVGRQRIKAQVAGEQQEATIEPQGGAGRARIEAEPARREE